MKVKYCGPARDYSGYGEANRHDIGSLVAAGVEVTTQLPVYCMEVAEFGRLGELAVSLEDRPIGYAKKIIHTTPNVYKQYMEEEKYHIGRAFWETDKAPLDFAINLQLMDEIWTGSEFNKQAMIKAGVTKPIFIIPEAIDGSLDITKIEPYIIPNQTDYKFYSLFEWTERKNPAALLEAYWREFENVENVSLTVKTYVDNFTPGKWDEVKNAIRMVKKRLQLKHYAPVYFYHQLMDRNQIYRFHKTFDCFVSTHRGEGWGIPQMEAMLLEKPIISTAVGGIHEYLTQGEDAYLLVDYKMVPVDNTRNKQWYTPDQNWAEVSVDEIRAAMRHVFDHQAEAKKVGKRGRQTVLAKFDLPVVGKLMRQRLEEGVNDGT